jgi:hypothetical protein
MLHRVIAEGKIEVRVRNRPPTVIMRMIKRRSRYIVAQKKNYQHPLTRFYQCPFHIVRLNICAKVINFRTKIRKTKKIYNFAPKYFGKQFTIKQYIYEADFFYR